MLLTVIDSYPKSGQKSGRSRTCQNWPDAGPVGAEIWYIPNQHSLLNLIIQLELMAAANAWINKYLVKHAIWSEKQMLNNETGSAVYSQNTSQNESGEY